MLQTSQAQPYTYPPTTAVERAFEVPPASFNLYSVFDAAPLGDEHREEEEQKQKEKEKEEQASIWRSLRVQWRGAGSASLRSCFRKPLAKSQAAIEYRANKNGATVHNVFMCRSSVCAGYCSRIKTHNFSNKLQKALIEAENRAYKASFYTLTIQSGTSIKEQQTLLAKAYRSFTKEVSRKARKSRVKCGFAFQYDSTFSKNNDYSCHLHIHGLMISEKEFISEKECFNIWERSVKAASHSGYYVSPSAFYFKEVNTGEARQVSRYISKFLKSSYEISGSSGKRRGFYQLVLDADKNEKALKAYNEYVSCFFRVHYSSIGKFISYLIGEEDTEVEQAEEEDNGNSLEDEEDTLSVEVSPKLHGMLCLTGMIEPVLSNMRMYSETKELKMDFIYGFKSVSETIDNAEDMNYIDTVHLLLDSISTHLGIRCDTA